MGLAVEVKVRDAEKVRRKLLSDNLLDTTRVISRRGEVILIPVLEKVKGFKVKKIVLKKKERKKSVRERLSAFLTKKELRSLPHAYDRIGDIIILDVPDELRRKEKQIAKAYLEGYPQVSTILRKEDIHSGVFRTQKLRVISGKRKKETLHKENGIWLHVHVDKMYFSPRLGHERLRIAKLVKNGENVLVMFSGCAPYVCAIARHSEAKQITGVEINPHAHKFAEKNIAVNHISNARVLCGDVRKVLPRLKKFDRIVMPLPKTGEEFLPLALKHVKKSVIHYYAFLKKGEVKSEKEKIQKLCAAAGKRCRIVRVVTAGQHAPYVFRYCFDVSVLY